jgi:hypothetical protein
LLLTIRFWVRVPIKALNYIRRINMFLKVYEDISATMRYGKVCNHDDHYLCTVRLISIIIILSRVPFNMLGSFVTFISDMKDKDKLI